MIPRFRAWVQETGEMLEVLAIHFADNFIVVPEETNDRLHLPVSQATIMQYTGCRDKNGIEIYEGDVIKDKYDKTWLVQRFVAAFVITDKIPDSDGQKSTYSHFNNMSNHHFYFEVIGNIYENPELLEVVE